MVATAAKVFIFFGLALKYLCRLFAINPTNVFVVNVDYLLRELCNCNQFEETVATLDFPIETSKLTCQTTSFSDRHFQTNLPNGRNTSYFDRKFQPNNVALENRGHLGYHGLDDSTIEVTCAWIVDVSSHARCWEVGEFSPRG